MLARLPLLVSVPDLGARVDDVPLLVRHLVRRIAAADPDIAARFCEDDGEPRTTARLITAMLRISWTTNVRELEAWLWRALRAEGSALDRTGEPGASPAAAPGAAGAGWEAWVGADPATIPPAALQACLDAHNGRQTEASDALGFGSRHVLKRLIRRHGLVVRRSGSV